MSEAENLSWLHKVPFTSRFVVADTLRGLGITVLLLIALMTILQVGTGESGLVVGVLPVMLAVMGGLGVVSLLTLLALPALEVFYELDHQGARLVSGRSLAQRLAGSRALPGGRLVRGPALLEQAGADRSLLWRDVHAIKVHPRQGVITLRDSWHTAMRLYCPPGQLGTLEERVRAWVTRAGGTRSAQPGLGKRGWLGTAFLATLAAVMQSGEALWPLLAAGLFCGLSVLLAGPVRRSTASLGLAAGGWGCWLRLQDIHAQLEVLPGDLLSILGSLSLLALLLRQLMRPERPGWETGGLPSTEEREV